MKKKIHIQGIHCSFSLFRVPLLSHSGAGERARGMERPVLPFCNHFTNRVVNGFSCLIKSILDSLIEWVGLKWNIDSVHSFYSFFLLTIHRSLSNSKKSHVIIHSFADLLALFMSMVYSLLHSFMDGFVLYEVISLFQNTFQIIYLVYSWILTTHAMIPAKTTRRRKREEEFILTVTSWNCALWSNEKKAINYRTKNEWEEKGK